VCLLLGRKHVLNIYFNECHSLKVDPSEDQRLPHICLPPAVKLNTSAFYPRGVLNAFHAILRINSDYFPKQH
jgi:hypothetical protein